MNNILKKICHFSNFRAENLAILVCFLVLVILTVGRSVARFRFVSCAFGMTASARTLVQTHKTKQKVTSRVYNTQDKTYTPPD